MWRGAGKGDGARKQWEAALRLQTTRSWQRQSSGVGVRRRDSHGRPTLPAGLLLPSLLGPGPSCLPTVRNQHPAECVCARVRVCARACVRACVFYKSPVNTPLSEMSSVPGEISHYVDPKPAFQTVCVLGSQQFPQSCSHSTFHSQTRRALDPASAPH